VSQFSGAVRNFNTNPKVALRRPTTMATINAVVNPSTRTPGTRYAAEKTANVERRREIRNFIKKGLKKQEITVRVYTILRIHYKIITFLFFFPLFLPAKKPTNMLTK